MSSLQCEAYTITGTRCKRNAIEGSKYCWQHQDYKQRINDAANLKGITSPRSPRGSPKNSYYFDTIRFKLLMNNYYKNTISNKDLNSIIAKGPLTIHMESKHYIKLPNTDIELKSGKEYSFGQVFDSIVNVISETFTDSYFRNLINYERSREEKSPPSTISKADQGIAFYSALYEEYDSENVWSILHDATLTGPSGNGDYYLRFGV
jgi:hypothetical protein